jgi:mannosyltransferase
MDFLVKNVNIPAGRPEPTLAGTGSATGPALCLEGPNHGPSALALGILAGITSGGALLRFHALAVKTFWFDEGVSVGIAGLDWYNFVRILWRREANMSLYYLLLRPWLHFGHSESFVRSLSVIFGVATIPAIYFLGKRLFDSRVGLVASALLAANAYHVRYSQEARCYSLMVLLCVCSSLLFLQYLEAPSRATRLAHIGFSSAAVYAHFYSGLLVAAQCLAASRRDKSLGSGRITSWRWIAVLISPIVLFIATTGAGPLRWIHRPGGQDFEELALRLSGNGGWILLLAYGIAVTSALIGDRPLGNQLPAFPKNWGVRFLLLWMLFPVALVFLLSFARPLFLPRYFIVCLPPLLLLAAAGLSRIRPWWLQVPALTVFLLFSIQGTRGYYRQDFDLQREQWRAASEYLLSHAQSGDALMFHVAMGRMPYEYYHSLHAGSGSAPFVLYPNHGDRISFLDFVEKPDYKKLEGAIAAHPRIWLVLSHASEPSGLDRTASSLSKTLSEAGYRQVTTQDFGGLEVELYGKQE